MNCLFSRFDNILKKNILSFLTTDKFNVTLIIVGIVLRFKHYLGNRSLWLDEAWVGASVAGRSFGEIVNNIRLFVDLANLPMGFLLIEKSLVNVLGNNEYVLRLFPLLSSIFAIILFYRFSKHYLDKNMVPVSLGLFIFCDKLIYYAAEVKQYSSDVMFVLLLYYLLDKLYRSNFDFYLTRISAYAGALILWFSNSCIFVAAGIGITLLVFRCIKKEKEVLFRLCVLFFAWLLSFVLLYKTWLTQMTTNRSLLSIWTEYFAPVPLLSLRTIIWFKDVSLGFFEDPAGFSFPIIAAMIFIIGCVSYYNKDKERFFGLILPLALVLVASIMRKYPFYARLLLFAIPSVFILIAQGIYCLSGKAKKYSILVGIIFVCLLMYGSLKTSVHYFLNSRDSEENRVVMQHFKDNYKKGDLIFMNSSGQYPFYYYVASLGIIDKISFPAKIKGINYKEIDFVRFYDSIKVTEDTTYAGFRSLLGCFDDNGNVRAVLAEAGSNAVIFTKDYDIGNLGTGRAWFLVSHMKEASKTFILDYFGENAKQLDSFERIGSAVYLYDLPVLPEGKK